MKHLPLFFLLLSLSAFAQTSRTMSNGTSPGACQTYSNTEYYCSGMPTSDGGWITWFVPTQSGNFTKGSLWIYAADGSLEFTAYQTLSGTVNYPNITATFSGTGGGSLVQYTMGATAQTLTYKVGHCYRGACRSVPYAQSGTTTLR
jgi:hypothetical protein